MSNYCPACGRPLVSTTGCVCGGLTREDRSKVYLSALREAVNEECRCGGRGPSDPGVCPACMVWHRFRVKIDPARTPIPRRPT